MKINKTPPTFPFEKKPQYKYVDMGFWNENKVYVEDWQLVRVDETKKK